jgi:hypothetical protein
MDTAKYLDSIGVHYNGTIKNNRSGLPTDGRLRKRDVRGTIKCFKGVNEENPSMTTYFTEWMDKQEVRMLHSYPTTLTRVERKVKARLGNNFVRLVINQPQVIKDYNAGMGGTDNLDQLNSYYENLRRGRKWCMRIFQHFFMTTVTNAFLIFKSHFDKGSDYVLLTFLENLINSLACKTHEQLQVKTAAAPTHMLHTPMMRDNTARKACGQCSKPHKSFYCHDCNVTLCIDDKSGDLERSCWYQWHKSKFG